MTNTEATAILVDQKKVMELSSTKNFDQVNAYTVDHLDHAPVLTTIIWVNEGPEMVKCDLGFSYLGLGKWDFRHWDLQI